MAKCVHHPGREATKTVAGKAYCQKCVDGIAAAVKRVDKHVEPKDCFVWYEGNDNWQPIQGTGCAHWIAHQDGIRKGGAGDKCHAGYTYRVKVLIGGMKEIALADVKVGDTYTTPAKDHTGLVLKLVADPKAPGKPKITIRHDSSGQGKVADNDFATYFKGKGTFWR